MNYLSNNIFRSMKQLQRILIDQITAFNRLIVIFNDNNNDNDNDKYSNFNEEMRNWIFLKSFKTSK